MRSRGADRPDDDRRGEQPGRSRRLFGRGKQEAAEPEEVPGEETGWLDDLRTAKEQRVAIGPGAAEGEAKTSKSGRTAPGPRDEDPDQRRTDSAAPQTANSGEAGHPYPPSSVRPSPAQRPPAQPSPAQPSPARPSPGRPSPVQSSPVQSSPAQPPTRSSIGGSSSAVPPAAVPPTSGDPGGSMPAGRSPQRDAAVSSDRPDVPPTRPTSPVGGSAAPAGHQSAGPAYRPASPTGPAAPYRPVSQVSPAAPAQHRPVSQVSPAGPSIAGRASAAVPVTGRHAPAPDLGRWAPDAEPGQNRRPIDHPPARPAQRGEAGQPNDGTPARRGEPRRSGAGVPPVTGGFSTIAGSAPVVPKSGNAPAPPPLTPPAARPTSGGGRPATYTSPAPAVRPVSPASRPTSPGHRPVPPDATKAPSVADGQPGAGPARPSPSTPAGPAVSTTSWPGFQTGHVTDPPGPREAIAGTFDTGPVTGRAVPADRGSRAVDPAAYQAPVDQGQGSAASVYPAAPPAARRPEAASGRTAVPPGAATGPVPTGYPGAPAPAPSGYPAAPPAARRPEVPPGRAAVPPAGGTAVPASARPDGSGAPANAQHDRPVLPVSPPPGSSFGSRNAATGRARPPEPAERTLPDRVGGEATEVDRAGVARATGRHGVSGLADRPGLDAPGSRTGSHAAVGQHQAATTGRPMDDQPASGTTTGSIVPPIVPGRQGIRTPALPGRAGAMAGTATGGIPTTGIKRPQDATGRATGAVSIGRVTGAVAAARVTGAVSGVAAPAATAQVAAPRRPADTTPPPGTPDVRPASASAGTESRGGSGLGGMRSELRRQMRQKRRLRMLVLAGLTLLVLGALPMYFGIRSASRDPVFNSLDALGVPAYAASAVEDNGSGSRWCFLECRFRERTAQSQKPIPETAKVYQDALTRAGWQPWKVEGCPEQPVTDDSSYTCWRRDEFTLDLWVRQPACQVDAFAAQDPAVAPSRNADGTVPTADPATCTGSTVSIKVQNAVTDLRGRSEPQPGPPLVGETPDTVLSEDPLLQATPSPS